MVAEIALRVNVSAKSAQERGWEGRPQATARSAAVSAVSGPTCAALGDLDCDGLVNFADINAFVLALGGEVGYHAQYPICNWLNADCNNDGTVNFADINPFVAILSGRG